EGTDREVDSAGGDDDRHAERDEHERRAVAQDVDDRAVQLPVAHRDRHETRARDRVDEHERDEGRDRQDEPVLEDPRHATSSRASSAMAATTSSTLVSCASSSPIFRLSRMTTMRWAMRTTSSSSEEMKTTARPARESS